MRLVIERGELLRALGHVTSVVERRTTIPILSNVLLKAHHGKLEFKATDLEREVIEEAPAEVAQSGAVTVPAHILHDIVRKLPEGSQVEMKRDAEKERLTLTSGQARFALQTLGPEDFPDLAAGDLSHAFEMPARVHRERDAGRGERLFTREHRIAYEHDRARFRDRHAEAARDRAIGAHGHARHRDIEEARSERRAEFGPGHRHPRDRVAALRRESARDVWIEAHVITGLGALAERRVVACYRDAKRLLGRVRGECSEQQQRRAQVRAEREAAAQASRAHAAISSSNCGISVITWSGRSASVRS